MLGLSASLISEDSFSSDSAGLVVSLSSGLEGKDGLALGASALGCALRLAEVGLVCNSVSVFRMFSAS